MSNSNKFEINELLQLLDFNMDDSIELIVNSKIKVTKMCRDDAPKRAVKIRQNWLLF